MAKQKFDINIKNFLWKDYLTKDIQVDDERIASVTLSLSDEAKNYIKLSDTTFPSADSSDGATPVVKKGIVNVSLIVTSTTNIKQLFQARKLYPYHSERYLGKDYYCQDCCSYQEQG